VEANLSVQNSTYWNELCGSRAARKLGITAGNPADVAVFDDWFFETYPYLLDDRFISWSGMTNQIVLEIGLGYGTVSRRLAKLSSHPISLDVASGAVNFVKLTAPAANPIQGSALELPLVENSVDCVISIGCLHHTGNLELALRECLRVLRPGGRLIAMVYNRYSYKRWIVAPISTWSSWRRERGGKSIRSGHAAPSRVSWFWDRTRRGQAPPHTEFTSKTQLMNFLTGTSQIEISTINVDNLTDLLPMRFQHVRYDRLRKKFLDSWLSRRAGLDLYVVVTK
jgi:SAM-dependent methyltransferase